MLVHFPCGLGLNFYTKIGYTRKIMELKGILHCHSTYSYDAKMTLAELKALFVSEGIKFVCMTEHTDELTKEKAEEFIGECGALSDSNFLFIPGFEVPYKVLGEHAHVLMIGMRSFYEPYAPTFEVLKRWTQEASFVVLAHPVRNNFLVDDGLLGEMDALEIWNQQYEGKRVPRVRSLKLLEKLKEKKPLLVATGGVDFHRKEHSGAPLVSLSVDTFSEREILEKLKTGAFTITSPRALVYGSLPDAYEIIEKYRWESYFSVCVIIIGKAINAFFAKFGIRLPRSIRESVRKKI